MFQEWTQSNCLIVVNLWWNSWKKRRTHSKEKKSHNQKRGNVEGKKKKQFENALVDEILEKGKWKCNIQESWEDKSNVIYSKEVVSLIFLGNTFLFLPIHFVPKFSSLPYITSQWKSYLILRKVWFGYWHD